MQLNEQRNSSGMEILLYAGVLSIFIMSNVNIKVSGFMKYQNRPPILFLCHPRTWTYDKPY